MNSNYFKQMAGCFLARRSTFQACNTSDGGRCHRSRARSLSEAGAVAAGSLPSRNACFLLIFALGISGAALSQHAHHNVLPEFDIRGVRESTLPGPAFAPPAAQLQALERVRADAVTDRIETRWSGLTGAPSRIHAYGLPLTGPSEAAPREIARSFLNRNRALFGLAQADVQDIYFSRDFVTDRNGVTHLTLQQRAFGIEVYGGNLKINLSYRGEIINVSGELIAGIHAAVNTVSPHINGQQAVQQAAAATGISQLAQSNVIGLVLFPVAAEDVRLAWHLSFKDALKDFLYEGIVDAVDGTLLLRKSATHFGHIPAQGQIFEHSPLPYTPQGTAPASPVPRVTRPFHGGEFFPHDDPHFDWWAGEDRNSTISNNVNAFLDRKGTNSPDAQGQPVIVNENFTVPLDLSEEPDQYTEFSVINLFYWNNRLHDFFYRIGFDEVSKNFQSENFGLGGADEDPVRARAQFNADPDDGDPSLCNARMSTPPEGDGHSPTMSMFLCDRNSPMRDTSLDVIVIGHEYTHGVHSRLVPTTGNQRANEGWADYFGLAVVARPDDPYDGAYPVGNYSVSSNIDGGGIRSNPYSTRLDVYPRRYADINDASTSCQLGVCSSDPTETCGVAGDCSTDGDSCDKPACSFHEDCQPPVVDLDLGICTVQVHRTGELWANALWIARMHLIAKHGFAAGDRRINQMVIDGMKLSPDNPTFLDGRDAILMADQVNHGGAHSCLIWDAFAKMGMGFSALTTNVDDINPLQAFDLPAQCAPTLQHNTDTAFGNVCLGETSTRLLQVFNQGGGDLIVSGVSRVSGSPDIVVEDNPATPVFIGGGSHVDFTVRCSPSTIGEKTATIEIASNDPASPHSIVYTCTGGEPKIAVAFANSGDFGNVCKGDHNDLNLTLFNQGQCNLTISDIDIIPPGSSFQLPESLDFPLVLSPDADFNVPIRYAPEECSDTPEDATLRIFSDSPSQGQVNIPISGTSACPNLVIDPEGLTGLFAFPATVLDVDGTLGCFSDRGVVLRNNGGCPLTIDSISAAGDDFAVTAPSQFPILLPPGEETLMVNVRFTPRADADPVAPGDVTGLLTIVSDDPDADGTAELCGESAAQSGVRILVTDITSGDPVMQDPVERIDLSSKGLNKPGPIKLTFNDAPLKSALICGNDVFYHVNQETLPSTDTTGGGGNKASYEAKAKQGNLQVAETFTLGQCELRDFQLQLQGSKSSDPDDPAMCLLKPKGESCDNDGECCSGRCRGPAGGMTCR